MNWKRFSSAKDLTAQDGANHHWTALAEIKDNGGKLMFLEVTARTIFCFTLNKPKEWRINMEHQTAQL